jgi:3-oxoadipate enol-lactonase
MPFVESRGARLRYEVSGPERAPWLVLSHSLGTDLSLWDAQVAALAQTHRVLRYDARGHGASAAPSGPYTIEQLAHDALALLDALRISRARFCGISMGGQTGLWLAAFAGDRIDRLVLANTGARIGTRAIWNERIAAVEAGGLAAIAEGVLARWVTAGFRDARPAETARLREMLLRTPAAGYAACCAALRDADLRAAARSVRAPTLVVTGAQDVATPPADGRALAAAIAGAAHVELAAGHLSNVEEAEAFTAAVARHVGGARGA